MGTKCSSDKNVIDFLLSTVFNFAAQTEEWGAVPVIVQ
jgi:hypothetical protein